MKIKKNNNKVKIAHYECLSDNNSRSFNKPSYYKTKVKEHLTKHGTKMHNVKVQFSELYTELNSDWLDKDLVTLKEDGNGFNTTIGSEEEAISFRLNYGSALDLMLALNKWHQLNGYGQMLKVNKKK